MQIIPLPCKLTLISLLWLFSFQAYDKALTYEPNERLPEALEFILNMTVSEEDSDASSKVEKDEL